MRGSLRVGVVLIALVAAGCGWLQSGYDAGKSNANPFENHVTPANVATLEDHTIPAPDPSHTIRTYVTAQGWIFLVDGVNVYAYTVASCPTADGSPCPVAWQAPAAEATAIASDGVRLFVSTGVGIDIRTLAGALIGHLGFGGARITVAGGSVYTTQTVATQYSFPPRTEIWVSHDLYAFPTGCDPQACTPATTKNWDPGRIATSISAMDNRGPDVAVFGGRAYQLRIRDGLGVNAKGVYDLSDPACQSPSPTCQPVDTYTNLYDVPAIGPDRVVGLGSVVQNGQPVSEVQWLPGIHSACPGTPATCAPLATADLGPNDSARYTAVGGDLIYVGTGYDVRAYAADGKTNCTTATPRVCSPLAQFAVGQVNEVQVVDRRVYASTFVALHILTIPGDVT